MSGLVTTRNRLNLLDNALFSKSYASSNSREYFRPNRGSARKSIGETGCLEELSSSSLKARRRYAAPSAAAAAALPATALPLTTTLVPLTPATTSVVTTIASVTIPAPMTITPTTKSLATTATSTRIYRMSSSMESEDRVSRVMMDPDDRTNSNPPTERIDGLDRTKRERDYALERTKRERDYALEEAISEYVDQKLIMDATPKTQRRPDLFIREESAPRRSKRPDELPLMCRRDLNPRQQASRVSLLNSQHRIPHRLSRNSEGRVLNYSERSCGCSEGRRPNTIGSLFPITVGLQKQGTSENKLRGRPLCVGDWCVAKVWPRRTSTVLTANPLQMAREDRKYYTLPLFERYGPKIVNRFKSEIFINQS